MNLILRTLHLKRRQKLAKDPTLNPLLENGQKTKFAFSVNFANRVIHGSKISLLESIDIFQ